MAELRVKQITHFPQLTDNSPKRPNLIEYFNISESSLDECFMVYKSNYLTAFQFCDNIEFVLMDSSHARLLNHGIQLIKRNYV